MTTIAEMTKECGCRMTRVDGLVTVYPCAAHQKPDATVAGRPTAKPPTIAVLACGHRQLVNLNRGTPTRLKCMTCQRRKAVTMFEEVKR